MNNVRDFVLEILTHPQEDSLRLVLADWLEERGDPRGELLRIQSALCRGAEFPDSWLLEARMLELLADGARPFGVMVANSLDMRLALLPKGEFLMGSPPSFMGETISWEECPEHRVVLEKPFYLGVYPVTQIEYRQVIQANPSYFEGIIALKHRPVEQVAWLNAVWFCNHLSTLEGVSPYYQIEGEYVRPLGGRGYRLPTEAEWEYACRAGTSSRWCFGNDHWCCDRFGWTWRNSQGETHPVCAKTPNAWGLYDMHGNVWEWCWDWFDELYYEACCSEGVDHVIDPTGPKSGRLRVKRGGCFAEPAEHARSGFRLGDDPLHGGPCTGFRVAKDIL